MSTPEKVSKRALYPLADHLPGVPLGMRHKLRARWTGEKRKPTAGEWYLSGAIVEAYRAPYTMIGEYHIAEIVKVEVTTTYHVTGIVPLS